MAAAPTGKVWRQVQDLLVGPWPDEDRRWKLLRDYYFNCIRDCDQEVVRVEHFHTPDDLLRLGRDCERMALSRGVRYHVSDRVLIHGNKSIVFRD